MSTAELVSFFYKFKINNFEVFSIRDNSQIVSEKKNVGVFHGQP